MAAECPIGWLLTPGPTPGRFADWTVESAKRCVIEEVGADSAIELPGALGEFGGQGGSGVSVGEADSAASWDNAEAAQLEL